ncbi:MAG: DUF1638 domain-containing protein [Thermoleophilia bacterium]|nr:DUF1638 domain-containing protein [Thermoleophilia bacterium]
MPSSPTGSVIIACEMMEDEVLLALEKSYDGGPRPTLIWFESGLHDRPERLQTALQGLIDLLDEGARSGQPAVLPSVIPGQGPLESRRVEVEVAPAETILLAMGYCGTALRGLVSREAHLVFPRVDDCISLFLNPGCTREEIERDARSYYLTRGWFCHSSSWSDSFDTWVERYGEEKARHLRRLMYAAYERVTLIDTGAYDVDDWLEHSQAHADDLELDHRLVAGSTQLLERLFRGPWDSEIVVVPPGEAVSATCLFAE